MDETKECCPPPRLSALMGTLAALMVTAEGVPVVSVLAGVFKITSRAALERRAAAAEELLKVQTSGWNMEAFNKQVTAKGSPSPRGLPPPSGQ